MWVRLAAMDLERTEEKDILALLDGGRVNLAAARVVELYGQELLRFIMSLLRDEDDARDVFSIVCERLLHDLPAFQGKSSLRTWLYTVTRRACYGYKRSWHRSKRSSLPAELEEAEARVRTATQAYLLTETKDKVAALRQSLTPDEQVLLTLRVDQNLPWDDIARVLADGELDEPSAKHEATVLRKRFERVKQRLRALAIQAGLIGEGE
jgi:RNA polymerase sigma-70 factor (ECF subfamily)